MTDISLQDIFTGSALLAAVISLLVALNTSSSSRSLEISKARRSSISNDYFSDMGNHLYEVVALSKKMAKARTDESYQVAKQQAEVAARRIDELRRKHRYIWWGLDEGFRVIKQAPFYVSHYRHHLNDANAILEKLTLLREEMDRAIKDCYFYGDEPSLLHKFKVWRRRRAVLNYFKSTAGGTG